MGVHLVISTVLILPVYGLIFLAWFPAPWLEVQGATPLVALMSAIHLGVAPVLTGVVYQAGKKGLTFDLVVIGLLQLGALGYGTWSIHSERPSYVVFAVDRYVPLAAKDVDFAAAGMTGFGSGGWRGPQYAFAEMPMGASFREFQESVLFRGAPDLERRPEFWRPLDGAEQAVLRAAPRLARLAEIRSDEEAETLLAGARDLGLDPDTARYLPIPGKRDDFVGLLDPNSARVAGVVRVDRWPARP